ncbi:hypothetical protein BRAS3809_3310001 [Bradyrhizobium sp. STM 3809]|nr:hypothetical protein BRAS3809_3310001 [Bradyrhizobium sp. STM 3809]
MAAAIAPVWAPVVVLGAGAGAMGFCVPFAMLFTGLDGIGGPTRVQVSPPHRKPRTHPLISR